MSSSPPSVVPETSHACPVAADALSDVVPVATSPVVQPVFDSAQVPQLPISLSPPKAKSTKPASNPSYQTRWEREKAKAIHDGVDIEHTSGRRGTGDPQTIGPWIMGEMLGKGASGRVKLARHCRSGKLAAVKILDLHPTLSSRASALANAGDKAEKMILTAEREIAVMKLLDHPNIMHLYDVWSSETELYLVLEYIEGGELFDYLCSKGQRLHLLEAVAIIKQVLCGVDYCHRFNICHRDLKPENILLEDKIVDGHSIKHVKIADFGMSTLDQLNGLLRTSCGSPHYASPEIVRGHTYIGSASDIWSCGVVFFALCTSRLPFDDRDVSVVLRKVRDGRFTIPEWIAPPAKDLITRMLEVDLNKRITMREIFAHPLLMMDTPGIALSPAPNPAEIALPVKRVDIDPDLLRNLCVIWRQNGRQGREKMVGQLTSEEKNFEKAFYYLLCRYRDKSFEEYNMDAPYDPSSVASPFSTPSSPVLLSPRRSVDFGLYAASKAEVASPIQRHFPGRVGARTSLVLDDPVAIASVFPPTPEKKREKDRGVRCLDDHSKPKISVPKPASPKKTTSPKKPPTTSPRKLSSTPRVRPSTIQAPPLGGRAPTSARTVSAIPPKSHTPQTRDETKLQSKYGVRSPAANPRSSVVAPPTTPKRPDPPTLTAFPPVPNARAPLISAVPVHPSTLSSAAATGTPTPPIMIPVPTRSKPEPVLPRQPSPPLSILRPVSQNQSTVDAAALGLVLPKTPEMGTSCLPGEIELDKTPRPPAPARAATVAAPTKLTAIAAANKSTETVSGSGSDASDKWERIDQVSQELLNLPAGLIRKQTAKTSGNVSSGDVKPKRRSKPAPLDLVHPGYNREHYQNQLSPLDGSGRQPLMPPFLGFGFGGFSWGVPPTPTISGAPQGTGRGMFAKLFDWKSPTLYLASLENTAATKEECARLLREAGVQFVQSQSGGFKCRVDEVVDAVGNYTSKTVRFRVEFDLHYNALSTPNTPLLSDPSSSSGSAWSPLGTPVINSGRSSIGNPALFTGTSAGHSTHTSQHMRHPSASLRNSRTGGSSASGNSRFSVSGVSMTGVVCTVSFVQEKGAYSTLRIVYAKVKDGWKFDRRLRVGPSPSPSPTSAPSRRISTFGMPGLGHERVIV